MRISFTDDRNQTSGALAVFALKGKTLSPSAEAFDVRTGGAIRRGMDSSRTKGDKGKSFEILAPANVEANRILVAGLGEASAVGIPAAQAAGGSALGNF